MWLAMRPPNRGEFLNYGTLIKEEKVTKTKLLKQLEIILMEYITSPSERREVIKAY